MIPGTTSSQGKFSDAPTSVSASAGNAQATVSFTLPVHKGKGIPTYLVTASPGGATASGSSSPITVTGLINGTSYTFTVTTVSGYGVSRVSDNSNVATAVAPTTTTTTAAPTTAAPTTAAPTTAAPTTAAPTTAAPTTAATTAATAAPCPCPGPPGGPGNNPGNCTGCWANVTFKGEAGCLYIQSSGC